MTLRPEPYRHLERGPVFCGLDRLAEDARARGTGMAALALAWVLHHPRVDAAIVGPRNPAHLDEAVASTEVDLSADDVQQLSAVFETAIEMG